MNPEEEAEEDGANIDLDSQRKGKCVVLKTSTRQVRCQIIGLQHLLLGVYCQYYCPKFPFIYFLLNGIGDLVL